MLHSSLFSLCSGNKKWFGPSETRLPPFKVHHALPGGFVDIGETVEEACRRELKETGVKAGRLDLIGVYSGPRLDPRGQICSIAFVIQIGTRSKSGDDADACRIGGELVSAIAGF
jgi:ADP-ribose pyrophosphatase YjhB (NUDIX family)